MITKKKLRKLGKTIQRRVKHSRYLVAVSTVIALSAAILMAGTFGWRSISQKAVNETLRNASAGGRLHDDFDGSNKDVYAENYMTKNEGGVPLYVRIRLDEYMEIGVEAGENRQSSTREATPVIAGTNINDVTTWVTHIPKELDPTECTGTGAVLHNDWTWTMGGSTVYMPTFNKNADSLKADINGTYEGTVAGDQVYYDDYKNYVLGETLEADATYDADNNDVEDSNVTVNRETHTAAATQDALVMTMKQWKNQGSPSGKYWVYDTDGWAYWAEALQPGEATGLLLDKVDLTAQLSTKCYYAINVVAQFATADDWGSAENPVGFYEGYDPANGITGPTEDALFLLNQAAGNAYRVTVTADGAARSVSEEEALVKVQTGETLALHSEVTCMERVVEDQTVVWSVKGASSSDTRITADGVLTVGKDETAKTLQVTAKVSDHISTDLLLKVLH